jgi:3-oxoacyl-[acyl-carrier protein] reductase
MKNNKSVLIITGTSSGLGKDLAKHFLKKNYTVCGCSRGKSKINKKNYFHSILDIKNEDEVKNWINTIYLKYKKIDFLINNAAIIPASFPVLLNNTDLVNKVFNANVIGPINLMNEVTKKMLKKKFGRIINFSSMAAGLLEEGTSLYSSSKKSLEFYSKIFAKELSKENITCNTIAPSMYDTPSFRELGDKIINNAKKKLQIKRKLKINEISDIIEFLFKKESRIINGQTIYLGLII